jgi:hypothetical protein
VENEQRLAVGSGSMEDLSTGDGPRKAAGFLAIEDGVVVWGARDLPREGGAFIAEASFLSNDDARHA